MTTSIVQASCAVDVVVCDDTVTNGFGAFDAAALGLPVLFVVLVAVVFVLASRRRR